MHILQFLYLLTNALSLSGVLSGNHNLFHSHAMSRRRDSMWDWYLFFFASRMSFSESNVHRFLLQLEHTELQLCTNFIIICL